MNSWVRAYELIARGRDSWSAAMNSSELQEAGTPTASAPGPRCEPDIETKANTKNAIHCTMHTLAVPVPVLILLLLLVLTFAAAVLVLLVLLLQRKPVRTAAPSEIDAAVARFLGAIQTVFHDDWAYSRDLLEKDMRYAVEPSGTFLEPGRDHEKKNWGARTALLRSHAELVALLRTRGLVPVPPERDDWFVYSWPAPGEKRPPIGRSLARSAPSTGRTSP